MTDRQSPPLPSDDLEARLRNVISHATGGGTADTSLSLNDICVRISQHRSRVWEGALEKGRGEALEEAARHLEDQDGHGEWREAAAAVRALSNMRGRGDE